MKAEYLHINVGKQSVTSTFVSPVDAGVYTVTHHNRFDSLNIARIGLNYHFASGSGAN